MASVDDFFFNLLASYLCSSNYNRLVSVSYDFPFFVESFKTPFTVSLVFL